MTPLPVSRKKKIATCFKAFAATLDQRSEGYRDSVAAAAERLRAGTPSSTTSWPIKSSTQGTQVRERYLAYVRQMQEQKADMEPLGEAIEHFCHITDNFAAGLFECYDVEGLPRTNNDLEHCFGVARVHERRATGRRGAIPGVVVRGSVRVIAAVVTREQSFSAEELRPSDYQRWRDLRAHLQQCEETRRQQFRFRKDPAAYLAALEAQLLVRFAIQPKKGVDLLVIGRNLLYQGQELRNQCQHQARFGPRGDGMSGQVWLMQGLENLGCHLLCRGMPGILEHLGDLLYRSSHSGLRRGVGLQEDQRRVLLQLGEQGKRDRIVSFEAGCELVDQAGLHLDQRILVSGQHFELGDQLALRSEAAQISKVSASRLGEQIGIDGIGFGSRCRRRDPRSVD